LKIKGKSGPDFKAKIIGEDFLRVAADAVSAKKFNHTLIIAENRVKFLTDANYANKHANVANFIL